ncbi:PadR family transcriptional regulator [Solirubrobacter ginsenosidimutans]|uniref:PadR family transcriptional regulator n=1 Tax=Solirubrobacter ginsenosidimutans TaxID=490573 RepID=A0A9X3MX03_9ACTN|nr:helix-turn-helix transcriptional regulator [Solirubrobacter ginsenosidimutans]MDA0162845.1 PadR family transcriptional regulator [Solirubrobacter ginsenosidimutans]
METVDHHRDWLRGVLDLCLLALLRDGEAYGYELARRLETLGFGPVAGGSLYPALLRRESSGTCGPSGELATAGLDASTTRSLIKARRRSSASPPRGTRSRAASPMRSTAYPRDAAGYVAARAHRARP